jgi:signal peptidase I
MVAVFLVMFWVLKTYVIEGYEVQGPSMHPTIANRERILVFKLPQTLARLPFFPAYQPIAPGDIVVFDSNDAASKRYIKRVIAAGAPLLRGNTVAARGLEPERPVVQVRFDRGTVYVNDRRLEEHYLMPDDLLSRDRDRAQLGPGEFYVLGDNRGESKDSRSFGPIGESQIIGEALLRFWPPGKIGLL